jgi:hypothetical protein
MIILIKTSRYQDGYRDNIISFKVSYNEFSQFCFSGETQATRNQKNNNLDEKILLTKS